MTYDFFLENYDFSEYEIKKLSIRDHKLYCDVIMPIYLELIANGYRPELDITQEKTFVFSVDYPDIDFPISSTIVFEKNGVMINGNVIKITFSRVDILDEN